MLIHFWKQEIKENEQSLTANAGKGGSKEKEASPTAEAPKDSGTASTRSGRRWWVRNRRERAGAQSAGSLGTPTYSRKPENLPPSPTLTHPHPRRRMEI